MRSCLSKGGKEGIHLDDRTVSLTPGLGTEDPCKTLDWADDSTAVKLRNLEWLTWWSVFLDPSAWAVPENLPVLVLEKG